MTTQEAYVEKVKSKIDQWNAEIEKFQAKARGAKADARIEYEEQVEELKDRRDALQEKVADLEKAGGQAWEDLKAGAEKALGEVESAFAKARDRFTLH
ncbi:hypothetical protein JCM30471_24850 [Desulfuromonas carbonis]|uniref:hypothetical protein n=1 Tax=Desulfuromonas sp. DDH964 TaxID=1823759 RepID=UPI00078E688D|nr:hypothetical protein [Desulfuromonas sp. DDH964]AMV70492.1 hypothetical protein DBW_0091 [Desulfuromonas sp. DDH964]